MELLVNQWFMILVKMPDRGLGFDEWGCVGQVQAMDQKSAITTAIQRAPSLTEHVPPGIMKFRALPIREVPEIQATVHPKESIVI